MRAPKLEGTGFEKHPVGWVSVVCSRVIDLGTHFNDKKEKDERRLMIAFESEMLMEDGEYKGQPFLVFANFNYSMYQNSYLNKFIGDWRGKRFRNQGEADAFDLAKLISAPAYCNITRSEDGRYTNIQTIGPMPEDRDPLQVKGLTILIDQENINQEDLNKLTDKMRERVLSAKETAQGVARPNEQKTESSASRNTVNERNPPNDFNDDVPF